MKTNSKKIFDSSHEEQEMQNSNALFVRIGLFASTVANTVALFAMAALFLPSSWLQLDGAFSYILSTVLVAGAFFVSNAFDYHGVRVYGSYFMAEVMAIASRKFRTPGLKSLLLVQNGFAFAACFFVSWQLSVQGSEIVSQWLTEGKVEAKAKETAKDMKETLNWASAQAEKKQHRLDSLKQAKERYIKENTKNTELYKEYLAGAEWANTTMKPTIIAAERKFAKDIRQAEQDLASIKTDTVSASIAGFIAGTGKTAIDKEMSKANRVAMIMDLLGVWPLYLVFILMMMQGTYKVKDQAPEEAAPPVADGPGFFGKVWNYVNGKFTDNKSGERQRVYNEKK